MRFHYLAAALTMVMLATACGAGTDDGGNDDQAPDGTLVAAGSRWVQTRNLSAGSGWAGQLEYSLGNALPTVHLESMTMYMARFTNLDSFYADAHELVNFDIIRPRAIEWPDTSLAHQMLGMAVSPDQNHVAGVVSLVRGQYLQVLSLDADGAQSILTGFRDVTGNDLVWRDDTSLLFSMDVTGEEDPDFEGLGGAIVEIDLTDLMAGGPEGEVDMPVVVGFDADAWNGVNDVRHLALSPDRNLLAYTFNGNIWLKDLSDADSEPVQVTRGPFPHQGAAFSPDGSWLALIEYVESRTSGVFLVPVTVAGPVLIDSDQPEGRTYRLDGVAATRILAWLPR